MVLGTIVRFKRREVKRKWGSGCMPPVISDQFCDRGSSRDCFCCAILPFIQFCSSTLPFIQFRQMWLRIQPRMLPLHPRRAAGIYQTS